MAIYARENGAGMMFEPEPAYESGASLEFAEEEHQESSEAPVGEVLSLVTEKSVSDDATSPDDDPEPPRPTGRPSLRVVK